LWLNTCLMDAFKINSNSFYFVRKMSFFVVVVSFH
jgi:hypothetical protein